MAKSLQIALLGASGYTGAELIRLLHAHPHAEIKIVTAESQAGKPIGQIFPHLAHLGLPNTVPLAAVDYQGIDLVFCCLPHGTTQEVIVNLPEHLTVIDLSADFRLSDPACYAHWYDHPHRATDLQRQAVYGLPEENRDAIRTARLIANPGCYPTSVQLPLNPLLRARLIEPEQIIIDAKSGITGAGRAAKQNVLFAEADGGISAYGIGRHRHMPEIEQGLSLAAGMPVTVRFTPHLMPMNRGILSTLYVTLAPGKTVPMLAECLHAAYDEEPFVTLLPAGLSPTTHQVRGTNHCLIGLFPDRTPNTAILVSVIDNLVKGASGQAVQNMNIRYGFPETLGLPDIALFP